MSCHGQRVRVYRNSPAWGAAKSVLSQLHEAGFEAYLAGGCVRDGLLGITPKDFDIATSATPKKVQQIFDKTKPIGIAFGVVMVIEDGFPFEVATFRGDGAYIDGRRPSEVTFSSAKEDAVRRDFTVNGLFYDVEKEEVLDFVDGRKDLERNVLRAIGDARIRFDEDHLRILRAVRFSLQLGFDIETETFNAAKDLAYKVELVSHERITSELSKILTSKQNYKSLLVLQEAEIAKVIFKLWYADESFQASAGLFSEVSRVASDPSLLWASLFIGAGVSEKVASDWMRSYKFSNKSMAEIVSVLKVIHDLFSLNHENFGLYLKRMDEISSVEIWPMAETCFISWNSQMDSFYQLWREYASRVDSSTGRLDPPLVSGRDLMQAGFSSGPKFKTILDQVYQYQIESRESNKAALLQALLKGKILNID